MLSGSKTDPETGARSGPERRWILAHQGNHFCECGCGKAITIIRQHRYKRGISKFIRGHEINKWIQEHRGKHPCQCGCGRAVSITKFTKGNGIPRFIRGHVSKLRRCDEWIKDNQGQHLCSCGCGQPIFIIPDHKHGGIPRVIHGHGRGMPLTMWAEQEQGKHWCSCGCGLLILIRCEHRRHGIPRFLNGHNSIGASNPSWKGGTSYTYATRRRRLQPKDWSRWILDRDGHRCRWSGCGSTEHLQAHHLIPFSKDPGIVGELWNGITLCERCHYKIKGRELQYAEFLLNLLVKGA